MLIDALARPDLAELPWGVWASSLCARHTGIGADGLLIVSHAPDADAAMRVVNADGSDGGMCGNGVRCVARHLVERHSRTPDSIRVRVGERVLPISCANIKEDFSARVRMGRPSRSAEGDAAAKIAPETMPADLLGACDTAAPGWLEASGAQAEFVRVHMPNPHAVVFCRSVEAVPVVSVGPVIESHGLFPDRTNVQFVEVQGRSRTRIRTWERGAGATRACGTGACAAVAAGVATGRLDRAVDVELPSGRLRIEWEDDPGEMAMTGPAARVFDGVVQPPTRG